MLTDVQLDLFFVMPTGLVVGLYQARLLSIREPVQYFTLVFLIAVTVNSYRAGFPVELKLALGFFYDLLLPFLFSKGKASRRIILIAAVEICLFADEIISGALWMALTNAPMASYDAARERFGAFVLMHAAHLVILIALLSALSAAVGQNEQRVTVPGQWLLVGFPVTQFALLHCMVNTGYLYFNESSEYYLACGVMVVVSFVAGALFLKAFRAYLAASVEHERVVALKRRLDTQYACCSEAVSQVNDMAKFRHDMRNHLQVISSLVEGGCRDAARVYTRDLSARLEEDGRTHG